MITKIVLILVAVLAIVALLYICDLLIRALAKPKLRRSMHFRDTQGRITTYRGVNVSNYSKNSPDFLPWHTKEDYQRLNKWGINLVRFQVFWEAIEPKVGIYNTDYLSKVVEHIKILEELEIDVIVDVHQDLYSRKFTGNGFPEWAVKDGGNKFKPQKEWSLDYLQPAVQESFKNFWKSPTLQDRYIKMLHTLYEYVGYFSNVIGIDVMNEPFPNLPFIKTFEKKTLSNFYQKIYASFSSVSGKISLFYESWIATSSGIPSFLNIRSNGKSLHYIPHYYPPFCHTKGRYRKIDKWLMRMTMRMRAAEAEKFRSPLIFGEYGIENKVKNHLQFVTDFMDECRRYQASCIWWTYDMDRYDRQSLLDDNKNEKEVVRALMDIYPQKIAGTDPQYHVDGNTFNLMYRRTSILGPTIIFVPEHLSISVWSNMTYHQDGNRLFFLGNSEEFQKVCITVKNAT